VVLGAEGNGKSFIFNVIAEAIGAPYVHAAQGHDLDNKFNGWVGGKLFAHIPDLKAGQRHDVAEILKPLITDRLIGVQKKGVDASTIKQCCNFYITSNHNDAVLVTTNDRRYAVINSGQREEADCIRDGLTAKYWESLRQWVDGGGQEVINEMLWTRKITHNLFGRAPSTTGRNTAQSATLGAVEQEIQDAIDTGLPGFQNDLINATMAREYIARQTGRKLTPIGFAQSLQKIGYVKHPSLDDSGGRIWNGTEQCRIYVRKNSDAMQMDRANLKNVLSASMKSTGPYLVPSIA
jgi:hypothetical protein